MDETTANQATVADTMVDDTMVDEHGRIHPPEAAGEKATLLGFLDFQRATLEWKCRGLSDEQLQVRLAPSTMTLGGLLKHLALVEDYWFTEVVAGEPTPDPWASQDWDSDPDWEWHSAADDTGEALRALWADRVAHSTEVVATQLQGGDAAALAALHSEGAGKGHVSLRWVLVHMIEEYARHNGHADLLRESIDGETGE